MRKQIYGINPNKSGGGSYFKKRGKVFVVGSGFWKGFTRIFGRTRGGKKYYSNDGKDFFPMN